MKLHYDSTHTDKLRVQCDKCKKFYRNKYSLHTHLRHFHATQPTFYACDICGKYLPGIYLSAVNLVVNAIKYVQDVLSK